MHLMPPVLVWAQWRGRRGRHFLAYSMLGCVTSREDDGGFRVVEVAFHNTRAHPRVPQLHDLYGFTLASLCPEVRPSLRPVAPSEPVLC